jgi:hypothetical protein
MPACECAVGCLCIASAALILTYYSYKSIENLYNPYGFDQEDDLEIAQLAPRTRDIIYTNVEKGCCENIKPRL